MFGFLCPLDSSFQHDDFTRINWSRSRRLSAHASTSDLGPASKMSSPSTTPTNFTHGDPKEHFDIFPMAALIPSSNFTLPRPCSLSAPVQRTPQSSAASCPGVEVAVVRQFDESLRERLCMERMHA